jgi:hypothetical protein
VTRRAFSVLALLLFAQLSVVGGVARCWLSAEGAHGEHAPVTATHDGGHGEHGAPDAGQDERLPTCTATSMCVVVMMPPLAAQARPDAAPEHARTVPVPTSPRSITFAPELPPPRG